MNVKTLLFFAVIFLSAFRIPLMAQQVKVISEPGPGYDNAVSGTPYFGYAGSPVAYNNHLYIYYDSVESNLEFSSQAHVFLAEYTDNGLKFFKNPDKGAAGSGFLFADPNNYSQPVVDEYKGAVFNNKLFLPYNDSTNVTTLAVFDGSNIQLAVNPDNSPYGYQGFATEFNNSLYVYYVNTSGTGYLGKYNASDNSVELIPNPDNSPYGVQGDFFVYNNKLYVKYSIAGNGSWHLASYDGSNWQIIANPDGSAQGYQGSETEIVWNNNLYALYYTGNQNRLMKFDGTTITLIPLPASDVSVTNAGFTNYPVIYNNNLYFSYYNHNGSGANHLAKYDDSGITVIDNPDNTPYGFWNTPVIYNNQICFFYANASGVHQLAKYNGDSVALVPNPDSSPYGYWNFPYVYKNKLFFQYRANNVNSSASALLGYYDSSDMHLITIPESPANTAYNGFPVTFNDTLFLNYANIQYGNFANLAYIVPGSLPVTLTDFEVSAQSHKALLQWHTATEINSSYFEVERSVGNSNNFISIGHVPAGGNSAIPHSYGFTDVSPDLNQVNFYRLKEADLDGEFQYSGIKSLSFAASSQGIVVYPNPVKDNATVQFNNLAAGDYYLQLSDVSGRILLSNHYVVSDYRQGILLNLKNYAPGIYFLKINDTKGNAAQTQKIIKQ